MVVKRWQSRWKLRVAAMALVAHKRLYIVVESFVIRSEWPARRWPHCLSTCSKAAYGREDALGTISLDMIRTTLIQAEDLIIFSLIQRASYAENRMVYQPARLAVGYATDGKTMCPLEHLLRETEQVYGKIRRYAMSDGSVWKERSFFPEALPRMLSVPPDVRWLPAGCYHDAPEIFPKGLGVDVNFNKQLLSVYINEIIPKLTRNDDDGCYGATICCDIQCLQALSKRIHFGTYVAEAKWRSDPEGYRNVVRHGCDLDILDKLTDKSVEAKVLERVKLKAAVFGQEITEDASLDDLLRSTQNASTATASPLRLSPNEVGALYDNWVVPLTKKVQLEYIKRRAQL